MAANSSYHDTILVTAPMNPRHVKQNGGIGLEVYSGAQFAEKAFAPSCLKKLMRLATNVVVEDGIVHSDARKATADLLRPAYSKTRLNSCVISLSCIYRYHSHPYFVLLLYSESEEE
jgi:hypothetical protein